MAAALATNPPINRTALGRETRVVAFRPELRSANQDGSIPFAGHAAVFNSRSQVLSDWSETFQEVIEPGAFASVLDHDVRLLVNHDPSLVLARTVSGTLRLSEDEKGLFAEGDMAPTSYGRDLQTSMARGDVTQMSFAFSVAPGGDRYDLGPDGMILRTISRIGELFDVSVVTYPAYLASEASLRAMAPTVRAVRAARARLTGEQRAGKRNSSADEAILQSAVLRLAAIVTGLQPLLDAELAEGDNDDDVAILTSAIETANDIATDIQALIAAEAAEPDEEESARAARSALMLRQQVLRHHVFAARYGVPLVSLPGGTQHG